MTAITPALDPSRVTQTLSSVHRLLRPTTEDARRANRREMRRRLAEIEDAEAEIGELRLYRLKLEGQLDEAAGEHQRAAEKIQSRLKKADVEKKVELRQSLSALNETLQTACDSINGKIAAVDEEIGDLEVLRYARPSLERGLLETGPAALRLELKVAERTKALAESRAKAAAKALGEFEREHQYQQDLATKRHAEEAWRVRGKQREQTSTVPPSGEHYELLKLESLTADGIASEATADVQRLKKQICDE